MADRVAGRNMPSEYSVSAARWLKRKGAKSLVVIEEADGTPFIGSVKDRISKRSMELYWVERDGWRTKDSLPQKWAGTNMAMAFSLLKRNGGLEDHATMSRLASGKKWAYQRYNIVPCKACQGDFRGPAHPLLKCSNLTMTNARNLWLTNCKDYIKSSKPARLRNKLSEILHHVCTSDGGEFAAVGTFIPRWVARLDDNKVMTAQDLCAVKKFLRVIAGGARLVMREYSRIKEVSDGDATELRQLSIAAFTKTVQVRAPKVYTRSGPSNAPTDNVWEETDILGKLKWGAPRTPVATALIQPTAARTETRAARVSATLRQNPWKSGLNWFSPPNKTINKN
jgi:hypothetical protein